MNLKKKFFPCAMGIIGVIFTCACKEENDLREEENDLGKSEELLDDFVESLQVIPQPEIPAVNTDSILYRKIR